MNAIVENIKDIKGRVMQNEVKSNNQFFSNTGSKILFLKDLILIIFQK